MHNFIRFLSFYSRDMYLQGVQHAHYQQINIHKGDVIVLTKKINGLYAFQSSFRSSSVNIRRTSSIGTCVPVSFSIEVTPLSVKPHGLI